MPGHDEHEQRSIPGRQRLQQQLFLALARARQQQHRPRQARAPGPSRGLLRLVRRGVEFQVAGDLDPARAQRAQARRVLLGLRAGERQRGDGGPRQAGQARVGARRFFRHARVREHDRHAAAAACGEQIRPDFGFHQQPAERPEMREEAPHRARIVVGQPGDDHRVAVQFLQRFTAGRGHAGQKQIVPGIVGGEPLHQRSARARLADGDCMHPQQRPRAPILAVIAEAFADVPAVARLADAAPPEARQDQRRQQIEA